MLLKALRKLVLDRAGSLDSDVLLVRGGSLGVRVGGGRAKGTRELVNKESRELREARRMLGALGEEIHISFTSWRID